MQVVVVFLRPERLHAEPPIIFEAVQVIWDSVSVVAMDNMGRKHERSRAEQIQLHYCKAPIAGGKSKEGALNRSPLVLTVQ